VPQLPNLDHLSHAEKDTLIRSLCQRLEAAERRISDLEARLGDPGKTPDNFQPAAVEGSEAEQAGETQRVGPSLQPPVDDPAAKRGWCNSTENTGEYTGRLELHHAD
jgi:hypothetical protein